MSKNFSAKTGGPLSIGIPEPLKALPSISSLIGIFRVEPVNSQWVCKLSIPEVPSNIFNSIKNKMKNATYTTALFPQISRTYPFLIEPSPK